MYFIEYYFSAKIYFSFNYLETVVKYKKYINFIYYFLAL